MDGSGVSLKDNHTLLYVKVTGYVASVWMDAMNDKQALDNYFILLKSILTEHDLLDRPGQIYNVESGIPLDHRSPCILTKTGQKKFIMLHLETNRRLQLWAA